MAYRRFTMEQKIRFLDLYEEIGTTAGAARKAGVPREACRRWLNVDFANKFHSNN